MDRYVTEEELFSKGVFTMPDFAKKNEQVEILRQESFDFIENNIVSKVK